MDICFCFVVKDFIVLLPITFMGFRRYIYRYACSRLIHVFRLQASVYIASVTWCNGRGFYVSFWCSLYQLRVHDATRNRGKAFKHFRDIRFFFFFLVFINEK